MAKIDLRAYYDEIESLINRNRYDEAIAHCRHILQVFPKSVQTYRLLGKAFLEARRYTDAVDIFQRVLSALPSDFVSHLGLSIIREDEGNLDAAIWHMERAFEIQPYNGAIQEELRRLYERRDGSSPPKIRLTRSALARMYAKGNLHQQSAAEARNILSAEPQRLDIQILLANMYLKSGKTVEAAEISSKVLGRLPYSLEANRILVRILENSEHREEYRQYKDRLLSLDPYEARVNAEISEADLVPNEVVQIDKLDLAGDQMVSTEEPADWMTSLGLTSSDFDTELDDELPEWLVAASEQIQQESDEEISIAEEESQIEDLLIEDREDVDTIEWLGQSEEIPAPPTEETPLIDTAETEEAEEIPDWMLEAGWQERTEELDIEAEEISFNIEDSDEDESAPAAEAEIPDWLRNLAPDNLDEQAEGQAVDSVEEDSALAALFDQQEDEGIDFTSAAAAAAGLIAAEEFADREKEETVEGEEELPIDAVTEEEPLTGVDSEAEEDLPEWLQEFDQEGTEEVDATAGPQAAESVDIPEWLADIDADIDEAVGDEKQVDESTDEYLLESSAESLAADTEAELPDWLVEFENQPEVDDSSAEVTATAATDEELPDWLKEIEDTPAENEPETAPDVQQAAASEQSPELSTDIRAGEVELEEPPDFTDADDALAWLAGLAAGQDLEVDEYAPEEREGDADTAEEILPEQEEVPESHDTQESAQPYSLEAEEREEITLESPPDFEDMDEAVSWLEELAEGTPQAESTTPESEVEPTPEDTFPDIVDQPEPETEENEAGGVKQYEKIDLNKASLVEIERRPGIGFRTAQLIVAYRDSHGPFLNLDDVAQVPGIEPDDIFNLQEYFMIELRQEESPPASLPQKQEDHAELMKARQAANEGDFDTAMQHYSQLVNDGNNLEDVIFDLNQQLQNRPDNIELWQLVGDAYMRNNQLIEAMQAYNKAEELLH